MIFNITLGLSCALLLLLVLRPSLGVYHAGRHLAFVAVLALPVIVGMMGFSRHVEHSKTTEFCVSCHVMEKYGKSLYIDDAVHIPAGHFQNSRVPRDTACFTCHTNYTMYGDVYAKLRGLRHIYVQYIGKVPDPIKLYSPFENRECLHCHSGSRSFEEATTHSSEAGRMLAIRENKLSCVSGACHGAVHDVAALDKMQFWKPVDTDKNAGGK